jgi:hypothetical protein
MLRARTARAEEPIDPDFDLASDADPEHDIMLADAVGVAMLVVLDRLSPSERLAFVLHDLFDLPFEDIAPILDKSPDAARQLASRARRRVRGAEADRATADRQRIIEAEGSAFMFLHSLGRTRPFGSAWQVAELEKSRTVTAGRCRPEADIPTRSVSNLFRWLRMRLSWAYLCAHRGVHWRPCHTHFRPRR